MNKQTALLLAYRSLWNNVHPVADTINAIGYEVLVFQEQRVNNRIGEWLGLYVVIVRKICFRLGPMLH